MRAQGHAEKHRLSGHRDRQRIDYWNGDKSHDHLFCLTALGERLRNWPSVFLGSRATGFVRAALPFASFVAGRIGENARRAGKLERPRRHRHEHGEQDCSLLPHTANG